MNYQKYTNDSDFYLQKDVLSCRNAIFFISNDQKKSNIRTPPWTFGNSLDYLATSEKKQNLHYRKVDMMGIINIYRYQWAILIFIFPSQKYFIKKVSINFLLCVFTGKNIWKKS